MPKYRASTKVLGEGGYGVVLSGFEIATNRRVALKFLRTNLIENEIKAMQTIKHMHVIRFIDFIEEFTNPITQEECQVVVFELASKGELFDYVAPRGLKEEFARPLFHQIARGIQAIHDAGIVHRDLKLSNILLDEEFNVKICDFGFAVDPKGIPMTTLTGTKGYMAPEILQGKGYNCSVDIFAAGVILFIILAGFPPFNNAVSNDWYFNQLQTGKHELFWRAHERAVQFSNVAKDLVVKMLDPNPNQRIDLEGVLAHPFFTGTGGNREQLKAELSQRRKPLDSNDIVDVDVPMSEALESEIFSSELVLDEKDLNKFDPSSDMDEGSSHTSSGLDEIGFQLTERKFSGPEEFKSVLGKRKQFSDVSEPSKSLISCESKPKTSDSKNSIYEISIGIKSSVKRVHYP